MQIRTKTSVTLYEYVNTTAHGAVEVGSSTKEVDAVITVLSVNISQAYEGSISYSTVCKFNGTDVEVFSGLLNFSFEANSQTPLLEQAYRSLLTEVGGELVL